MTDLSAVRATGPADLLALVPGLLGFHPEDSLVVMTIGDATHTFHARIDLPADFAELDDVRAHITQVSVRNGVRSLALLAYTDDARLAETVVAGVGASLCDAGVDVVCAVRADGARWWSLHRSADDGPGTPYDVGSHPLMAQAVVDGTVVLRSRQELADTLVGTDPAAIDEVARLVTEVVNGLAHAADSLLQDGARHHLVVEGRWVRHRVRRYLRDGVRLDDLDVARLLVLIELSTEVRDVAWAEMTHANAPRHVDLWRDLVRRSPADLRAAPAALLGFAAWLSGHGALAWCAVDRAHDAQPDYRMASLLTQVLATGMPPSTWEPVSRDELTLFAG
jgi:hypothetical protein